MVSTEIQSISISEELDHSYPFLTGICILDNIGTHNLLRSSSLDGQELFPKNFEVGFIQSNLSVAPDQRFLTLSDKTAEGNKIEMEYVDGGNAPRYPYTLKIYLRLRDED